MALNVGILSIRKDCLLSEICHADRGIQVLCFPRPWRKRIRNPINNTPTKRAADVLRRLKYKCRSLPQRFVAACIQNFTWPGSINSNATAVTLYYILWTYPDAGRCTCTGANWWLRRFKRFLAYLQKLLMIRKRLYCWIFSSNLGRAVVENLLPPRTGIRGLYRRR